MYTSLSFKLMIAIALVIAVALTAREAVATSIIKSQMDAIICDSLPPHHSMHSEYVKEADMWVLRTEDAPTGVDGGLIDLQSNYRTCLQKEN